MLKDLIIYGSEKSVRIGSIFMQYNYKVNPINNPFEIIYLGSLLVSSLKKDFTGYDINPEDLIRMKLNDMHIGENENKFLQAKNKIDNIIKNGFPNI